MFSKAKSNRKILRTQFESLPVTAKAVHQAIVRDKHLSRVYDAVTRRYNDRVFILDPFSAIPEQGITVPILSPVIVIVDSQVSDRCPWATCFLIVKE